jgi:hypothetical protein
MLRWSSFTTGLLLLASPALAQRSLTIYNDGRVMVRAALPARVSAGNSSHKLALGFLDPGSVFSLDPETAVMGASYDAAVDEQNTLRRAIGRKLVFETGGWRNGIQDTVIAEVIGVEPELFRLADGTVSFQRPGRPRYPLDLVLTAPTVSINVRSTAAREQLRLAWFTDGAAWNATYQAVLGRGTARVTGQAQIQSGRLSADEAEIQLLAGNVGRAERDEMVLQRKVVREMAAAAPMAPAEEQQVGEAHLYTIPGRYSVRPGVTTVAALFEPAATSWERVYSVRGQLPWYGPVAQHGEETQVPVEVQYVLKRGDKTGFGKQPLPMGAWRVFEPDSSGRLQLVGEATAGHTAAGQDLRLTAGTAFDLTAERIQTEFVTQRESRRTVATLAYRVTLTSAKDSAVTVDVLEDRRGEWQVLESSLPAEKLSSTQTRFRVRVPGEGQATLTYRLRVVW